VAIPININDLLSAKTVESDRIEFKEGWNPSAIYRSICAFANDFDNIGGGYILIGVAEEEGAAKRPVLGLSDNVISEIQRKMIGFNNLINPPYDAKLFIESVDKKKIIVLWVPGGSNRPYEVPEEITAPIKKNFYFIRRYANSVKPNSKERQELILLANQVPFDDRVNTQAPINDISMVLVQDHLRKIGSKLAKELGKKSNTDILKQMELVSGPAEHEFPRNVALMLFSEHPEKYFPYTQIELVHFPEGTAGKEFNEKIFTGPVQTQITQTLNYIKSTFLVEKVVKVTGKAQANRISNYPFAAIEEAIANCIYHRNYQEREPIKIRIERGEITLHNAGGPDRSIRREDFAKGKVIPKRYRNRRLGDFLKELELTEGHATGCSTIQHAMKANGSPDPVFDFDEDRTWFQVTLPNHPAFKIKKVSTKKVAEIERKQIDLSEELLSIEERIDQVLKKAAVKDKGRNKGSDKGRVKDRAKAGDIARDIAGDIVRDTDEDIVRDIAIDAQNFIDEKKEHILLYCRTTRTRKEILKKIKLVSNVKNFNTYVAPLLQLDWVEMTIPDKPSSPKQRYRTTLKGMIVTELMLYHD
jgi:ATP-dependent DNA helicase RecG